MGGGGGVGGFGWILFGGVVFESGVVGVCDFGKTAVAILAWLTVKSYFNLLWLRLVVQGSVAPPAGTAPYSEWQPHYARSECSE